MNTSAIAARPVPHKPMSMTTSQSTKDPGPQMLTGAVVGGVVGGGFGTWMAHGVGANKLEAAVAGVVALATFGIIGGIMAIPADS